MRIIPALIECSHKNIQDVQGVCDAFCTMGHVVFVEDCPGSEMLTSVRLVYPKYVFPL